jgi:molybdate transport system substrate-binding protein
MRRTLGRWAALLLTLIMALGLFPACSSDKDDSGQGGGTLHVFAAASLTETFTALGKPFEKDHPGWKVDFNFAGSSALATQITEGDDADVFASAAPGNMDTLVKAGNASDPKVFARNTAAIATPPSNPKNITSVADLAKDGVLVAVCQPQVPCGKVAQQVFTNAGITVPPTTEEKDVKSTLAKVTSDEVDAAVVYVTDVKAAGDSVHAIEIPADINAGTDYPIAVIQSSKHAEMAQTWVDFVLSAAGQSALQAAGFQSP